MPSQQEAATGDFSLIIQIIGDGNTVGVAPHLTIRCPSQKRRTITEPTKDEAALLRPGVEVTEFVGRTDLIKNFVTWAREHDPLHPVSVRVIHGGAGTGKTRFARELCRVLGSDWQAGLVEGSEARRFLNQNNLINWGWQKPTLIVFDYALSLVDVLSDWTRELCHVTQRPHPLRILLLERQAEEHSGWLEQAFPGGFGFDATGPQDLLDGKPMLLPGLNTSHIQRGIMQNMLDHLGSKVTLPPDDAAFHDRLASTDWAGAPLYLMMAAMVMHQQGGVGEVLHLGRVDLAHFVATHEHSRLNQACSSLPSLKDFLPHMAAFATLCGGVDGLTVMDCVRQEKAAVGCENADTLAAVQLLSSLLPDGGEGIAPIRPDIVGEAFLLERLAGGRQSEGKKAVSRAFGYRPSEVAAVLVRCVQDFVPRQERNASEQTKKAQQRAQDWLRELGYLPELSLNQLLTLVYALPQNTGSLRILAVDLQRIVITRLQENNSTEEQTTYFLAENYNNLANRLNDIGMHNEALGAAKKSVYLHRKLTKTFTEDKKSSIAISFMTLSSCLSNVNLHKRSLSAAKASTARFRVLVNPEKHPTLNDYAQSLVNLAHRLIAINNEDTAMSYLKEALSIYESVASKGNITYKLQHSLCLNNLSSLHSAFKEYDTALSYGQRSNCILKDLSNANQDSYMPFYAKSLCNLSNRLSETGENEEALATAQMALKIYHKLATSNPDIFIQDIADCFFTIAERYHNIGDYKNALKALSVSAKIYLNKITDSREDLIEKLVETVVFSLLIRHDLSWEAASTLFQQAPQIHIDALIDNPDEKSPSDTSTPPERGS